MENSLPSFWSEGISRVFAEAGSTPSSTAAGTLDSSRSPTAKPRKGQTTSTQAKTAKVLQLTEAGHTLSEISGIMGVSKSYVHKLLKMAKQSE